MGLVAEKAGGIDLNKAMSRLLEGLPAVLRELAGVAQAVHSFTNGEVYKALAFTAGLDQP